MKLVIQIPCFNEAETLPTVLAELPRAIAGFDTVEILVIDDGSTDETPRIARESGAHHVVRHTRNRGLAQAFRTGLDTAVKLGADVIVNTDGDHQYRARDIPALVGPILEGRADVVIGARPIADMADFSPLKKLLQRLGSSTVRRISGTEVEDVPSGFRAMSRAAAMRLHVFNDYTYTLETVIQAGTSGMAVLSVPVGVNRRTRGSRLIRSIPSYIGRQAITLVRIYTTYRPVRFFGLPGLLSLLLGVAVGMRFLFFYIRGDGSGHVQSLILGALLMGIGVFLLIVALVADLISANRKLLEDIDGRLKALERP